MPGFVLTSATVATCPHGGQVTLIPSQSRVLADAAPAVLAGDQAMIAGCPFTVSGAPSPCLTIQWSMPAARASVSGTPVLLSTSLGLCLNPASAPQGPVLISSCQSRVQGS